MNLGELLEELRENILADFSDQIAGVRKDQLWTDRTLVRYINEAQKRFAKRSECLRDAVTPEVCTVQLVAGQRDYAMHPKVIGVLSGRFHQDQPENIDLARVGHANLDTYRAPDSRFFFDVSAIGALKPGKPLAFTTDEGMLSDAKNALNRMTLRSYPVPSSDYAIRSDLTASTIDLRVVRFPLIDLSIDDMNGEPEIPEQYHMNMLDYAGYLALRKPDLDVAGGGAQQLADKLAKTFDANIEDAKRELKRRMFAPAAFKFGGNGFTFERDWDN